MMGFKTVYIPQKTGMERRTGLVQTSLRCRNQGKTGDVWMRG